jgi:N-acetylmuramoyl-L-alanine amidase
MTRPIIFIDPGHGGSKLGITHPPMPTSTGGSPEELNAHALAMGAWRRVALCEKDIALDLGLELRHAIKQLEWPVIVEMTREVDVEVANSTRGDMARGLCSSLVLSIHANGHTNPAYSGMITFGRVNDELGCSVARTITSNAPAAFRRHGNAFFSCDPLRVATDEAHKWLVDASAVVHRFKPIPTALVEVFHMTNDDDRAEISNQAIRKGVINSLLLGVEHGLVMMGLGSPWVTHG